MWTCQNACRYWGSKYISKLEGCRGFRVIDIITFHPKTGYDDGSYREWQCCNADDSQAHREKKDVHWKQSYYLSVTENELAGIGLRQTKETNWNWNRPQCNNRKTQRTGWRGDIRYRCLNAVFKGFIPATWSQENYNTVCYVINGVQAGEIR